MSSKSSNTDQDALVTAELSKFIMDHTGLDALSSIDEIVLSYIIGVLETLGCADSPEDVFDVDEFAEMMTAYIPAFSNIHSSHTYAWMLNLASWLKETSKKNEKNKADDLAEGISTIHFEGISTTHERHRTLSDNSIPSCLNEKRLHSRSRRKSFHSFQSFLSHSSTSPENEEKCIAVINFDNEEVETLTEMFPHLQVVEIKQFLSMASGDCERAVHLILQKGEADSTNNPTIPKTIVSQLSNSSKEPVIEDKDLRKNILKRYAYIDQNDDLKEHRPVAPKTEPKKLIRYRDSKIVSIKGERYSEIKKAEYSDDH